MIQIRKMPRKQAISRRVHSSRLERAKIVPRGTDLTRHIPAGPRKSRRVGQYVASKFTAAVFPPLITMATRSPGAGL